MEVGIGRGVLVGGGGAVFVGGGGTGVLVLAGRGVLVGIGLGVFVGGGGTGVSVGGTSVAVGSGVLVAVGGTSVRVGIDVGDATAVAVFVGIEVAVTVGVEKIARPKLLLWKAEAKATPPQSNTAPMATAAMMGVRDRLPPAAVIGGRAGGGTVGRSASGVATEVDAGALRAASAAASCVLTSTFEGSSVNARRSMSIARTAFPVDRARAPFETKVSTARFLSRRADASASSSSLSRKGRRISCSPLICATA